MGFGFAFALGMLGSLHCAVMCGPLMVALPAPPGSAVRFIAGRVLYQLGRILTYGFLGVMAGMVGRSLFLIGLQRWLSIALGLAVLTGLFVSKKIALSTPSVRLVAGLKKAMSQQLQKRDVRSLILLGMLNGLLPCGLVYVAFAGAVASGGVGAGAGYMAFFGLGTLPATLSICLFGKLIPGVVRLRLSRLIPIGVCGLAVLLILRGMALGIPYLSPDLASGTPTCCAH